MFHYRLSPALTRSDRLAVCCNLLYPVANCCICCKALHHVVSCRKILMAQNSARHPPTSPARARLAALREKKAPTKAAQIRALWPEIKTALDNGHNLQSVCECLEADGINVNPRSLASYVSRIRRASGPVAGGPASADRNESPMHEAGRKPTAEGMDSKTTHPTDPLANVRERQRKRSAFDYRPELADPKELI